MQTKITSKEILNWYYGNKRELPFRFTKDPYKIWISEVMLQQTQMKTVIPFYNRWVDSFPTIQSVARAKADKILKSWEGLGYYRRSRNLMASAKIIVNQNKSILPKTLVDIKKLPGIGDYTGNVLLALVYNQPRLGLDGNVKRVFSRIFNKHENKLDYKNIIEKNKKKLFFSKRNSVFVEAMMEFGALICKPKEPLCNTCPINKTCKFFNSGKNTKLTDKVKINKKSYNIFCYLNKKKQIGLKKNNYLGFLKEYKLPIVKEKLKNESFKNWNFLCNYKNSISNKKLDIDLYYKFSKKIPKDLNWYSLYNKKEFIPTFTKKIFKQVEHLY